VIDEENYHRLVRGAGTDSRPRGVAAENPADVSDFTAADKHDERAWELAEYYKCWGNYSRRFVARHYLPEETLRTTLIWWCTATPTWILKVFANIDNGRPLYEGVGGVSYLDGETVRHILPNLQDAGQIEDCDARLVRSKTG